MQFSYNAAITEPPTGNQLRLNNADQTLATRIWVQKVTTDNIDVATFFYLYGLSGNLFYAQDRDDSTKRQRYTLTADGLDKGTYYEFQVSWLSGGLALPTQTVACALRGAVREGLNYGRLGSAGVHPSGRAGSEGAARLRVRDQDRHLCRDRQYAGHRCLPEVDLALHDRERHLDLRLVRHRLAEPGGGAGRALRADAGRLDHPRQ